MDSLTTEQLYGKCFHVTMSSPGHVHGTTHHIPEEGSAPVKEGRDAANVLQTFLFSRAFQNEVRCEAWRQETERRHQDEDDTGVTNALVTVGKQHIQIYNILYYGALTK